MLFDRELAERICREMGMEFHPEQEGVTIGGKKLPDNFSTAELFRGEYDFDYEKSFVDTFAPVEMFEGMVQAFPCANQEAALAA